MLGDIWIESVCVKMCVITELMYFFMCMSACVFTHVLLHVSMWILCECEKEERERVPVIMCGVSGYRVCVCSGLARRCCVPEPVHKSVGKRSSRHTPGKPRGLSLSPQPHSTPLHCPPEPLSPSWPGLAPEPCVCVSGSCTADWLSGVREKGPEPVGGPLSFMGTTCVPYMLNILQHVC